MKEIIDKMHQHNKSKLPCRLFVDRKYLQSLARKIPTPSNPVESFLKKTRTTLP